MNSVILEDLPAQADNRLAKLAAQDEANALTEARTEFIRRLPAGIEDADNRRHLLRLAAELMPTTGTGELAKLAGQHRHYPTSPASTPAELLNQIRDARYHRQRMLLQVVPITPEQKAQMIADREKISIANQTIRLIYQWIGSIDSPAPLRDAEFLKANVPGLYQSILDTRERAIDALKQLGDPQSPNEIESNNYQIQTWDRDLKRGPLAWIFTSD